MIRRVPPHSVVIAIAAAALACHGDALPRAPRAPLPPTEFLLLAGDSTFWVKTGSETTKLRGSPIQIARYGGRFYEIYLADDDRSYPDAAIVGERLYRRDLLTGDSLLVFEDTAIAGVARWYARTHPGERPLSGDSEPSDEPRLSATSELSVRAHHGRYLSYEYRLERDAEGADPWHAVRRGVIDLERGEPATLAGVFGDTAARRIAHDGAALFSQALDSVTASRDRRAASAVRALADFRFDPASFTITDVGNAPAVEFIVVGRGPETSGKMLTLPAIPAPAPAWWSDVSDAMPVPGAGDQVPMWHHGTYDVAVFDTAGSDWGRLTLIDHAAHRWTLGRVPTPAWRIFWLDMPAVDSTALRALSHAFDEAALYAEDARTASLDASANASGFGFVAHFRTIHRARSQ